MPHVMCMSGGHDQTTNVQCEMAATAVTRLIAWPGMRGTTLRTAGGVVLGGAGDFLVGDFLTAAPLVGVAFAPVRRVGEGLVDLRGGIALGCVVAAQRRRAA